ncbi:hypothetical protein J6590_102619, partial [Homalodisca vitripennis]
MGHTNDVTWRTEPTFKALPNNSLLCPALTPVPNAGTTITQKVANISLLYAFHLRAIIDYPAFPKLRLHLSCMQGRTQPWWAPEKIFNRAPSCPATTPP